MKRKISIIDKETDETLDAEIESIILSAQSGKVKAMMVVQFPVSSYLTLQEWLESIRDDRKARP